MLCPHRQPNPIKEASVCVLTVACQAPLFTIESMDQEHAEQTDIIYCLETARLLSIDYIGQTESKRVYSASRQG